MTDLQNPKREIDVGKLKITKVSPPSQSVDAGGMGGGSHPPETVAPATPSEKPERPLAAKALRNPLRRHSLRGHAAQLEAEATDTVPLFGDFVMHGQSTMIYAEPNAGKTLIMLRLILDAIEAHREEPGVLGADPNNLFYINADDSSRGLAEKGKVLELRGAHMVAPNLKGFKASEFSEKLRQAAEDGSARGTVVIIDTLKKFTNLMDKARSAEFAQVSREYIMAGGTIVALGHTAKNNNKDGTPRYEGTTDIRDGFDAVYVGEVVTIPGSSNEKYIRFTQIKTRADSPAVVAYAYSTESGLSYADKLASVRALYPEDLENGSSEADIKESSIVAHLRGYIFQFGALGQEMKVKYGARDLGASRSEARRVLDKYTGTDPEKHQWNYTRGPRGIQRYYLLNLPSDED